MRMLAHFSIKRLLFDDLGETCLPADILLDSRNSEIEVPSDARFQINKRMDIFVTRAGRVSSRTHVLESPS
jgi:N-alpha-acetyltransferase 35, NatC auxiliary subunit